MRSSANAARRQLFSVTEMHLESERTILHNLCGDSVMLIDYTVILTSVSTAGFMTLTGGLDVYKSIWKTWLKA